MQDNVIEKKEDVEEVNVGVDVEQAKQTEQTVALDTHPVDTQPEKDEGEKERKARRKKQAVSATKVTVGTGVFAALAYAISFLEFPIFPAVNFLKLDFSLVFILLAGFIYGPIAGISASAVKEGLCAITKTTGGVGELANFGTTVAFIIVPTVVYLFKKGFPTVIITLLIGCVLQIAMALVLNRFVNFPLFITMFNLPLDPVEFFNSVIWLVVAFNAIKTVAVSIVTILVYKRLSKFIKFVNSKF